MSERPAAPLGFQPLWSQSVGRGLRGLAVAREQNRVLVWDEANFLYLFDEFGRRQEQTHFTQPLVAACAADDGSAYAVADNLGRLSRLTPGFVTRWQVSLPASVHALAMSSLGDLLAASDQRGGVHLLDPTGKTLARFESPRPLHHTAFVPEAAWLAGCADYGLAGAFDLTGAWLWRDAPVVRTGALSVNGDGSQFLLACFSEGLRRYGLQGKNLGSLNVGEPCRLVSQSYDGRRILIADLSHHLYLVDAAGNLLAGQLMPHAIAALAMGPLGDFAVVASLDGFLSWLAIR